jgi:hypothetical protein
MDKNRKSEETDPLLLTQSNGSEQLAKKDIEKGKRGPAKNEVEDDEEDKTGTTLLVAFLLMLLSRQSYFGALIYSMVNLLSS